MNQKFFEKPVPIFNDDFSEWKNIKKKATTTQYKIIWYASSGLDLYPVVALANGKMLDSLSLQLENTIFVMSDYHPKYLETFKGLYKKLDNGPVKVLKNNQNRFEGFENISCNIDGYSDISVNGEAFVDQMVPLKLWDKDERTDLKNIYEYNRRMTNHPIPDSDWHIIYFSLMLKSDIGNFNLPIIFIGAENLLIFEKLFRKYQIPIELFFAVRVAGKSGSWDSTHDFKKGKLPYAIQESSINIRPKYWGLEESKWGDNIPQKFKKIGKIDRLGYGGCSFFQTNWR